LNKQNANDGGNLRSQSKPAPAPAPAP